MTREEAIRHLQEERDALENERDVDGSDYCAELKEALDMAIKALKTGMVVTQNGNNNRCIGYVKELTIK